MKKQILSVLLMLGVFLNFFPTTALSAGRSANDSEPRLTDLVVCGYENGNLTEVSIVNQKDVQLSFLPITFKAVFLHPERLEKVYITIEHAGTLDYLETTYAEGEKAFIADCSTDFSCISVNIGVAYTKNLDDAVVSETVDWDYLILDEIGSEQVNIVSETDISVKANIDFSTLLEEETQVILDTSIDFFDASTGGNLDEFLGQFEDMGKVISYEIKALNGDPYIIALDYSDKTNCTMLVKDISGNKYLKMALESSTHLDEIANKLSPINTGAQLFYDYFSINEDTDKLRADIKNSTMTSAQVTEALQKVDEFERDKQTFSIVSTVLPLIVSSTAATGVIMTSAPAVLFTALLSAITSSTSYFWDNRVGLIETADVNLAFTASGECGDDLTWTLDRNGVLRISGSGDMWDYNSSVWTPSWSGYSDQIKTLVLEEGITRIGKEAFHQVHRDHDYSHMTGSLNIPNSVTSIGAFAFTDCTGLTSLTLSNNLVSIGSWAFKRCTGFTGNLQIPGTVESIGEDAFYKCAGFSGPLTLPNSLTTLGSNAFFECSGFDGSLTISNSLTCIEDRTFAGCENLTGRLLIPDSVLRIGNQAFRGCENFKELNLGYGVETIGESCFDLSYGMTPIYIPASVKSIARDAFGFRDIASDDRWPTCDVYFFGDAPEVSNINDTSFQGYRREVTLFYLPDKSGWIESDNYDVEKRTWNGYRLRAWGEENLCDHNWRYKETTIEPTYDVEGEKVYECLICKETKQESIPPLIHDPSKPVTPDTPNIPDKPDIPPIPNRPDPDDGPSRPSKPAAPEKPAEPEAPAEPEVPVQPETPAPQPAPAPQFADVAPSAWYSEAAGYVSANGIMTGTGGGAFSPNAQMTRAMLWTVLGRLDGAEVSAAAGPWYAGAQAWCVEKGVSDGANPNGNITRQELVTMLWRYAGSPAASADLTAFTDASAVSNWAAGAVEWAVSAGLLQGSAGALNPAGTATRAEVAAILMRFCRSAK